ncbi:MAG TPA: hypothetical protein VH088_02470 [Terriglobales bacterium]|nr:hypothetical protein [Terriglobales bacterium]
MADVQSTSSQSSGTSGSPVEVQFKAQTYQPPKNCLPCHQRQYDELHSSVKSGYRNVSPLFNGLEFSSNLLAGGLLRPVYADSTVVLPDGVPLNTNMFTTPLLTETRQVQAGFCYSCHNAHIERAGDDPAKREVPQLAGLGANFVPQLLHPLRDFHLVDANGNQELPATIGGYPPAGSQASLGAGGITCDFCHNVQGPDLERSFQMDGFANMSLKIGESVEKTGPFLQPVAVKGNFHVATNDPNRIAFLRSSALCNACHDVRVPNNNVTAEEHNINPGGEKVEYYRLENLSTEWQTGLYNSTNNPFGKVIRCQDCHMSLFPFSGNKTYTVGDMTVTSPQPAVFPQNFAAVPGVATDNNAPLPMRQVVTHYFTGIDVPLLAPQELKDRLGETYPDPYEAGTDEYGIPNALATRRADLLDAAVRISLSHTEASTSVGQPLDVSLEAVALTGHRFPAGFSQERTGYVELTVTDDNGFVVYQSGYQVDKPHPQTGEMAPDGNLDDEDLEHLIAVVDGGKQTTPYATGAATNGHLNLVFESGPDNGPDGRVYAGISEGLVLFRNELIRVFLPGDITGRTDASGNPVKATTAHFEESFSASFANSVDNYRSLPPLEPRTYHYEIEMPTQAELAEMGVTLKGPLHVHAQVNFEHFPPLFVRFLAAATGPNGPTGHDIHLLNEGVIDSFLKNVRNIASADTTVNLQ